MRARLLSILRPLAQRARARLRPLGGGAPGRPLRVELDGAFVLDGEPVLEGQRVELLLPGGAWLPAELRREPGGWPSVWVTLGGAWEFETNGRSLRRPYLAARVSPETLMRRVA